jgi:hypothetical protein
MGYPPFSSNITRVIFDKIAACDFKFPDPSVQVTSNFRFVVLAFLIFKPPA